MADKITKTFRRVVRTGDFESVEIVSTIERELTTSNPIEYNDAVLKLRDEASEQLVEDLNMVLEKLGLDEKRVFIKSKRVRPAGV